MQKVRVQLMRKAAGHISAVIRGVLFIGFTIQILLGLAWMVCNFTRVQDFGAPDSALYGWLFGLTGQAPWVQYLVQLLAAFFAGYAFLGCLRPTGRILGVWRGLALLTFPFAMQCHLALQPYSLMGTLLLVLLFVLLGKPGAGSWKRRGLGGLAEEKLPEADGGTDGKKKRRGCGKHFGISVAVLLGCAAMIVGLSGWADAANRGKPGRSFSAAMASRLAWPSMLYDWEQWPKEVQDVTENVLWEASFAPGNWELLAEAIESSVDEETARVWYREIAEIGWRQNTHAVLGQIGWDGLGYLISPVVVRMQLEGRLYDSCTGRNYEIMRTHTPILTKLYVNYGCWWFPCSICLTLLLTILSAGEIDRRSAGKRVCLCILVSGIVTAILVMRGAGLMDYRYTIAVNELWLVWALLLMGGKEAERKKETW